MPLKVIGTGVGRTGTYSLKLALNELGLGPCYHMEEILLHMPDFLPKWQTVRAGNPDWSSIYQNYNSAVDWPTSAYYRELYSFYPDAKFVLTVRDPDTWAASFGETINALVSHKEEAPAEMRGWLDWAQKVIEDTGFSIGSTPEQLASSFRKHNAAVKAAIPASQLLVFEVKQGWAPLCDYLGLDAPEIPFPCSNNREEFWEKVQGGGS